MAIFEKQINEQADNVRGRPVEWWLAQLVHVEIPFVGMIVLVRSIEWGAARVRSIEWGGTPQCHWAAMPRGRFSNSPITQLLETSYSLKNSNLETSYSLKNKRGL